MHWNLRLLAAAALAGLTVTAVGATRPAEPSVDDLVARAIAARGGFARVRAVRTVRLSGRIAFGLDPASPFAVEIARGGRMRESFRFKGRPVLQVTDGTTGWMVEGAGAPRELSPAELRNMAGGADLDGPLVDSAAKGDTLTYLGRVEVGGRPAYALRIADAAGRVQRVALDCRTYLQVRWEGDIGPDGHAGVESMFRDYRRVDGLMFAFAIDSHSPGQSGWQVIRFERVEVDVPLAPARFEEPAAAPADSLAH